MRTDDRHASTRATLTVSEVSARLGVPVPTVRGWIRKGVLPSLRIGGRRLVRVEDLERLVNSNTQEDDQK
jgi:excisionase family DNA binding protein